MQDTQWELIMKKELSLAKQIYKSRKPFIFFHTHEVTKEVLLAAINENKSMDLDICVDDTGMPYLGHSREYYEKLSEPWDQSIPLWEAVELLANANIPVMVDCKHYGAWRYVEDVVTRLGAANCLVHAFIFEFDFHYIRHDDYYVRCEWLPVEQLKYLKSKFPAITTTASARGLPPDILISDQYQKLLKDIKKILISNQVDTVCLNVPDNTFSNRALQFFLADNILPHVMIDKIDTSGLTELYIGETDLLESASKYTNNKTQIEANQ